ncbi:MAG: S-ribosylhomocysteine lyase [Prevotellaceae bacterium]|jgi:S-ribosylhomocysteine lyase|nr:S-ribosylhomocysteine lyase [Prevotellaceae bacterium]
MDKKINSHIESFELDHDLVKAPYVRLIARESGPQGDVISNFDIRFAQPNVSALDTSSIHTLEHCLAGLLRDRIGGLIDISPFGCLTGFHAIFWGAPAVEDVIRAFESALEAILDFKETDVPGISRRQCGNYKMHSLFGAKEWAKEILKQGISSDYMRNRDNT